MLIPVKSDEKEDMRAGKVLILSQWLVEGENEDEDLALVLCMECVPPSNEADEALRCLWPL